MMNPPNLPRIIADNQRAAVRMLAHFARGHGMLAELRAAKREIKRDPSLLRVAAELAFRLFDCLPAYLAEVQAEARAKCPALADLVIAWKGRFDDSGTIKGSEVGESPAIPAVLNFSSLADAGAVWDNGRTNPGAITFDELTTITPLQTRFGGWWEAASGLEDFHHGDLVSPRCARAMALRTYAGNEAGTY